MRRWRGLLGIAALLLCAAAPAQRRAVLNQIDVPHDYYFREMYLPQQTNGPGSVAFTPDGATLVYSMRGTLWRQRLDATTAVQLTAGPGYDYQPDVSPDGRTVVFSRYTGAAMELQALDLASGTVTALTSNGAVNCEPRWSPDGGRLAWVSTAGSGHFHIFVGTVRDGRLAGGALWPERRSTTPRYYYSAFDHELSPSWSPDGSELAYVGNPEIIYGTGAIWRRAVRADAQPVLVRAEETTWRARPDWSRDGKRIVYSSYAGRNAQQLWETTAAGGGDPLALGYGDFDATGARWSPDGGRIAFLSNQGGDTQIRLLTVPGGAQQIVTAATLQYLKPMGRLTLRVTDGNGSRSLPARIAVVGADGRAYAPDDVRMHADDGFDRSLQHFETHYFHGRGEATLLLPPGPATITIWHGLATAIARRTIDVKADQTTSLDINLEPLPVPAPWRAAWRSGDVHVHMNYSGNYQNTPAGLVAQAGAEDLDVVFDLIVNKEQRIPDIRYFSSSPDPASTATTLLAHSQEFHTSYWGHLGLLGLNDHFLLPAFAAYANTAAASLYPTNAAIADLAHAQGALVGYVHPFDQAPDPAHDVALTNELPVDVALGKVDYYEVVGFSDHRASAGVWHRLLNCGFRPAAAAGTDAMTNFASLRGPVGLNRVYVASGATGGAAGAVGDLAERERDWLAALKAGHSMATNSALLGFSVDGQLPGAEIEVGSHGAVLRLRGFMRSIVPMDHLEILYNGKPLRSVALRGDRRSADLDERVRVAGPGWILLRAWNDHSQPDIFDIYPYATTNPVFLAATGTATHCGADADYFLAWIDRLDDAARRHGGYNNDEERRITLGQIAAARKVYADRR